MVTSVMTKRILYALADAIPLDAPTNTITRLDIHRGWGNSIQIDVHIGLETSDGDSTQSLEALFRSALDNALGTERHELRVHQGIAN